MRAVEGHPDFARLEARLVALIREAKAASAAGPFAPVLVVVPTARLRAHLQEVLARRCGVLLNVSLLDYSSLVREAAGAAGADLPREIPRRAREAVLEGCLGPRFRRFADYVGACPGALPSLLETMDELRNAGVDPEAALGTERHSRRGREVLELYDVYCERLAALATARDELDARADAGARDDATAAGASPRAGAGGRADLTSTGASRRAGDTPRTLFEEERIVPPGSRETSRPADNTPRTLFDEEWADTIVGRHTSNRESSGADAGATVTGLADGPAGAMGWADPAGVRREAARHVRAWSRRFDSVIHYGAYELIGSNLELMRAIENGGTHVTYLLPWHPSAPAFEYARRFVTSLLGEQPRLLGDPPSGDRLLGDRLHVLYDEEAAPPPPLDPARVAFFHTQGPEAELRETALRILDLVRGEQAAHLSAHDGADLPSGVGSKGSAPSAARPLALSSIAIIARSLEPYAPLLEPILHGRFRIPFTTSASLDALADPHVMAALNLARVVLDDCERQPLLDLARSGLAIPAGKVKPDEEADDWDLLARKCRIMRGRDAWTRELLHLLKQPDLWTAPGESPEARESAERRLQAWRISAERLASWIDSLHSDAGPLREVSSWEEWADAFEALLARSLEGFGETPVRAAGTTREEREDAPHRVAADLLPGRGAAPHRAPGTFLLEHGGALDREAPPGARAFLGALDEMRDLEAVGIPFPRESGAPSSRGALHFLEISLRKASGAGSDLRRGIPIGSVPPSQHGRDNGGVRVLAAEQARGLAFDVVFLIGFNADLVPRRPREDPFLGDSDRALLRDQLARPLEVKSAGREEEHLLLAHLLGCARERLTISWQRADETGRARVESLALREVARLALGGGDLALLHDPGRTHRVAAHPADAAAEIRDRFRLMPAGDAAVGAFLEIGSPQEALRLYPRLSGAGLVVGRESLAHGLERLSAIESFEPRELRFDAIVGADAARPPVLWSPSRLEDMGNCPQQYFFRHVLRVAELDAVLEDHEIDLAELGLLAHKVLQEVYAALAAEGLLGGTVGYMERGSGSATGHGSAAERRRATGPGGGGSAAGRGSCDGEGGASETARRAIELLEKHWPARFSEVAAVIHRRFPLMWRSLSALWKNALRTFLLHDLSEAELAGSRVVAVESLLETAIPLGSGAPALPIRGRIDRVVLDAAGRMIVGDYKTMGNLQAKVDMARILKGRALQMPLYVLMQEAAGSAEGAPRQVSAEVIGVGPGYSEGAPPSEPAPEGYPARAALDVERMEEIREGLHETIRILSETAAGGLFPLNPESDRCGWCPYVRACRRSHEPTLARLSGFDGAARYFALSSKSSKQPLIAAAAEGAGGR